MFTMAAFQHKTFLLVVLLLSFGVTTYVAADEDNQDYAGPLELPEIARYHSLPTRLFMRPEFQEVKVAEILPVEFVEVFARVLDGDYDTGLHRDAAQSLERVSRENLGKKDLYLPSLRGRLKTSESRIVLSACALALVAADDRESAEALATLCRPDNEVLCGHIEPRLAEWQSQLLQSVWRERLRLSREHTVQLMILACQGLAKINDTESVEPLMALLQNDREKFPIRKAAAAAIAELDQTQAAETAAHFATGSTSNRLLAVTLLATAEQPDALALLSQLCDDSQNAIAAVAWDYLEKRDRQRLVNKLTKAIGHSEPNVRKVAVRVMRQVTSDLHSDLLNQLLNDEHIFVRNHAREALCHVASIQPELKSRIVENAGSVLADPESTWQSVEQSLLVLGMLRHPDYQELCVPLLSHSRNEVLATAGWLLHLMPRPELAEPIVQMANQQFEFNATKATGENSDQCMAISNQLMYLFHHSAYTGRTDIRDVASEMFSKSVLQYPETRAAGIWALATVFAGENDEELRGKFSERLHDDNPSDPESLTVKQAAALSLGILGMKESVADLELAQSKYGVSDILADCVRSALRMLGESPADAPPVRPFEAGNWPIMPSTKQ